MRLKWILVVALLSLVPCAAWAEEAYLCFVDLSTGFDFDKDRKEWHEATFTASGKYIVTQSERAGATWEVKEVGKEVTSFDCREAFNTDGALLCGNDTLKGGVHKFFMNKNNLRFLTSYLAGYWTDNLPSSQVCEGCYQPYIDIGTCRPITY